MTFRPLRFVLVGLVAAVLAPPAMAAESTGKLSPAEIAKITAEVTEGVVTYGRVFSERNPKGVVEGSFNQPSFSMGASGVAMNVPEKQIAQFDATLKRLADSGWEKSVFSKMSVCVLNANAALASGLFTRYRKDGSEHSQGSETFIFTRTKEGWRIVSTIGHDAFKTVTCSY